MTYVELFSSTVSDSTWAIIMKTGAKAVLRLATSKGGLYGGDCITLLRQMKSDSVDCIFADPPFNLGKRYGTGKIKDRLSDEGYFAWTRRWLLECVRVLKPGGSLFIYHV